MTFSEIATTYLATPTPENLAALHDAIRSAPNFDRNMAIEPAVRRLLDTGAFSEAAALITKQMPGAFLSPSTHAALSEALAGLGDVAGRDREATLAQISVSAIRNSGDGTRDHPWRVIRVADEYDLLTLLRKRSVAQSLHLDGADWLDAHQLDDNTEVWFTL